MSASSSGSSSPRTPRADISNSPSPLFRPATPTAAKSISKSTPSTPTPEGSLFVSAVPQTGAFKSTGLGDTQVSTRGTSFEDVSLSQRSPTNLEVLATAAKKSLEYGRPAAIPEREQMRPYSPLQKVGERRVSTSYEPEDDDYTESDPVSF